MSNRTTTRLPDGTMEAIATGELRIEDLPREWRTLLGVEEDAPADDPSPLKMTRVRRKLLAELEWSNAQEWKGKGGTYDKIGHRAFLGVAWRTNRLEALGVATREFAELIGTSSLRTASRVIARLVKRGVVQRADPEPTEEPTYPYRRPTSLFNVVLHNGNIHSLSLGSLPYLPKNVPVSQQPLPEAFWGHAGLSKSVYLVLGQLDRERRQRNADIARATGKHRSTVSRALDDLKRYGMAAQEPEGWFLTTKTLDELAEELGTVGARDELRRYNTQQREDYDRYLRYLEEGNAEGLPSQNVRHQEGLASSNRTPGRSDGGAGLPERDSQPLQSDHGQRVSREPLEELGHRTHVTLGSNGRGRQGHRADRGLQGVTSLKQVICTNPHCKQQWMTADLSKKCVRCGGSLRVYELVA